MASLEDRDVAGACIRPGRTAQPRCMRSVIRGSWPTEASTCATVEVPTKSQWEVP